MNAECSAWKEHLYVHSALLFTLHSFWNPRQKLWHSIPRSWVYLPHTGIYEPRTCKLIFPVRPSYLSSCETMRARRDKWLGHANRIKAPTQKGFCLFLSFQEEGKRKFSPFLAYLGASSRLLPSRDMHECIFFPVERLEDMGVFFLYDSTFRRDTDVLFQNGYKQLYLWQNSCIPINVALHARSTFPSSWLCPTLSATSPNASTLSWRLSSPRSSRSTDTSTCTGWCRQSSSSKDEITEKWQC